MRKEWRRQKKESEANKKANQEAMSQQQQEMMQPTSFNNFQSYGQLPAGTLDFY